MINNTNLKTYIQQQKQLTPGFRGNNTTSGNKDRSTIDNNSNQLSNNSFIVNLKKLKNALHPTNKSKSYNSLKHVLESNFKNNLKSITKEAAESAKYVKDQLTSEYGQSTADSIDISGDKTGYNSLIIVIPGTNSNGELLDIFPIVTPTAEHGNMGGGHWNCEYYFANQQLSEIVRRDRSFNFETMRQELNLNGIIKNDFIPTGAFKPAENMSGVKNSITIDSKGYPNYATLHGFLVYDNTGTKYIILDDKIGVREFVNSNKQQLDKMANKFNIKSVIIGGYTDIEKAKDKEKKEKDDTTNQLLGQLSKINVNITDLPDINDSKQITNTELIKLITNTTSNKKYTDSIENK